MSGRDIGGDESEMAAVLGPLYPGLRRIAAVAAPLETEPDDLVQEAIVRMLASGRWSSIEDKAAYLRRTVVNLAANERRRLGRQRAAVSRQRPEGSAWAVYPSDVAELERLDPTSRVLVYLVEVEGRTAASAAEAVGCTALAARARLSRARRRLRVALEQEESRHG